MHFQLSLSVSQVMFRIGGWRFLLFNFFSSATGDIYACFYKMCCPNEEAGASQAIEIKLRRYASGTFLYHPREADEHAL